MSETPDKPDWSDGMVTTGLLMVTLCGLCSGGLSLSGESGAVLASGGVLPILVGIGMMGVGLGRGAFKRRRAQGRGDVVVRIMIGLIMMTGAIIAAFSAMFSLGALLASLQAGSLGGFVIAILGGSLAAGFVFIGLRLYNFGRGMWR